MAAYEANIRIGVTGKAQLNQLEAQLKRTQTQLNKLNKSLQLRTRVQAIRLDTRAANTAIKQLEQRINRLGRTINVNLRVNEKEGRKSQGSSNTVIASPQQQAKQQASALAVAAAQQRRLKDSQREQLKIQKQINPLAEQQARLQGEIANQVAKIAKNRAGAQNAKNLKNQGAQLNRLNFGYTALIGKLNRLRTEYKGVTSEVRKLESASRSASEQQLVAIERRRQRVNDLRLQKNGGRYPRGLRSSGAKGALASGSLALSSVPGLGGAATGALVGGGVGGPAGAVAGAAVGFLTELTGAAAQYANQAAIAAAEQEKFNTALRGITAGNDYQTALQSINDLSEQFIQDVGTTTEQFTKLTAATTANGISVEETAEVYKGLAAANLALGGNSERLQGILLATGQVFSKGKVQAEELRGQIGERLPGAFALFAKSVGKTPAELDKALEKGEVTVEDFVTFTKALFEQYGENAKIIRDGPANAGARLEKALGDLQRSVGALLAPIGAAFQNTFTAIVKAINAGIEALNRFLGIGTDNALAKVNRQIEDVASRLDNVKGSRKQKLNEQLTRLLAEQKRLKDLQKGTAEAPTKPTSTNIESPNNPTGTKSGPRDTTAELRAAIALEQELLRIEKQRTGLSGLLGDLREQDLQRQTVAAELDERRKVIQTQNITEESKVLATKLAEVQAARDLQSIENATAATIAEFTRNSVEGAQQLIQATNLVAQNEERRKELLAQGINPALADALIQVENQFAEKRKLLDLDIAALETALLREEAESEIAKRLKEQLDLLKKLRGDLDKSEDKAKGQAKKDNPGKVESYLNQLKEELADVEGMVVSLAQTVVSELSNAMSTAVTGLIDGTTTAQEAFSDMFKNIGKAFISMAMDIIAKQLMMIALQTLFNALSGGTNTFAAKHGKNYYNPSTGKGNAGPNFGMADGGPVAGNQPYLVGERGPELFVPTGGGSIVPSEALAKYSRANGSSTKDMAGSLEGGESGAGGTYVPSVSISTGPVMQFEGANYVSQEQFQAGVAQAAAQGARAGEMATLRRLKQNPSTRRGIGL